MPTTHAGDDASHVFGDGRVVVALTVSGAANGTLYAVGRPQIDSAGVLTMPDLIIDAGTTDITEVEVNCTTNAYAVGGTVSGLSGSGLVLQNNGGDDGGNDFHA